MSMTQLIQKSEAVQQLFQSKLGNIQSLFKTANGKEAFPSYVPILSPVPKSKSWLKMENAAHVGVAYDWFLRAFIQRRNHLLQEKEVTEPLAKGLHNLKLHMKHPDWPTFLAFFQDAWTTRIRYMEGHDINTEHFAKALLFLGYVEDHYRSPYAVVKSNYQEVNTLELENLILLMTNTENQYKQSFFTICNEASFNPEFGTYSQLVGNADADLVVDGVLVDIKTKSSLRYQYTVNDVYQIIGYYILDKFNKKASDKEPFSQIGLYFSRHDHFVFLDTKELEEQVDINALATEFFAIAHTIYGENKKK